MSIKCFVAFFCLLKVVAVLGSTMPLYGIPENEVVVWSTSVENDQPITNYRGDVAVNPASTMKVLTSYSGLVRLGPDFRWRTTLTTDGHIVNGILNGNLYWVGQGDAMFSLDDMIRLQDALRSWPIQSITGKLRLDQSVWVSSGQADDFSHDTDRAFMVPPDPHLMVTDGAWLNFFIDQDIASAEFYPPLKGVNLLQKMHLDSRDIPCPDVSQFVKIRQVRDSVALSGTLPVSCNHARAYITTPAYVQNPGQYFIDSWHHHGQSGLNSMDFSVSPPKTSVLAFYDSRPLSSLLFTINKMSDNTRARTLYLTLGAQQATQMDTLGGSEYAVRKTLAEAGISDEVLVLENGAGLSRKERVSARLMGELLRHAARGPYAQYLMDSFPIAGIDGTLKYRFPQFQGRLFMKTGTLADVRALAGYWRRADGKLFALVVIINSPKAKGYLGAMDKIVRDQISIFQRI